MRPLRRYLDESRAAVAFRRTVDTEALMWVAGLLVLAASDPYSDFHFTLFWPQWVFGIQSPGHGLGHSIAYLFRGDLFGSLDSHMLGVPVVIALTYRIIILQARKLRTTRS
jgi:hypothetical protein